MTKKKAKKKKPVKKTYTRKRQTGKSNLKADKRIKAKTPGKRRATGSKKSYYEYRKNRTDKPGFLTGAYSKHNTNLVRAGQELNKLDKEIGDLQQDVKSAKTREAKAGFRSIIRSRKKQFRDLRKYINSLARVKIK